MDSGEGGEGPLPKEPAVLTSTELAKIAAMVGTNHVATTIADYASHIAKYKVISWVLFYYSTINLTMQNISF